MSASSAGQSSHIPATMSLNNRQPRVATDADVSEIVRVINLAYRVEDFFIDGDRTNADDVAEQMSEPDACFLVVDANEQQRLAAAVFVETHNDRGHFTMLSVDPAYQGKGLGRALITAVEDHCAALGCRDLDIEVVNLRRELPAFYSALGFIPSGATPFPNRGKLRQEAHLVLMTKSLESK
jgi:ribosomal protein S18 acetylase RimI-like enzyme